MRLEWALSPASDNNKHMFSSLHPPFSPPMESALFISNSKAIFHRLKSKPVSLFYPIVSGIGSGRKSWRNAKGVLQEKSKMKTWITTTKRGVPKFERDVFSTCSPMYAYIASLYFKLGFKLGELCEVLILQAFEPQTFHPYWLDILYFNTLFIYSFLVSFVYIHLLSIQRS